LFRFELKVHKMPKLGQISHYLTPPTLRVQIWGRGWRIVWVKTEFNRRWKY